MIYHWHRKQTFNRVITSIVLVAFVVLQLPAAIFADETRYAENRSVTYEHAEEDNINIPLWGYVSAYRITATLPEYYPLEADQAEKCSADWSGLLIQPPLHVEYYDASTGNMMHTMRGIGTFGKWWRPVEVFDDGDGNDVGQYIDHAEAPEHISSSHLVYYDATAGDLKYMVERTGVFEEPVVLDSTGQVGEYCSIALDTAENAHIAYYDRSNGNLKYVCGPDFTPQTIDSSSADVGRFASLEVDSDDTVHVAYYDVSNGNLKYICRTAGSWGSPVTVDSTGDVGQDASLDVDGEGNVHVAYYDASNGNLKYAVKAAGGSWSTPVAVDSTGDVGQYCSLGVNHSEDSNGNVHIGYYDASNGNLKYAVKEPAGSWQTQTLDSTGDVGKSVSLRVYPVENDARYLYFDGVFMSYYDASNQRLKAIVYTETDGWGDPEIVTEEGNPGQYSTVNFMEYWTPMDTDMKSVYDDGNLYVEYNRNQVWWIPREMDLEIVGGSLITNVHQFSIMKRHPDADRWSQLFAMYSSSHMRPLPFPETYMLNDVCYGCSVLQGAAAVDEWPHDDMRKVVIDPENECMDIYLHDGGHQHVSWQVQHGEVVFDVTEISTDVMSLPFATVRAMYVEDQRCIFSRAESSQEGPYRILPPASTATNDSNTSVPLWEYADQIKGDWWNFTRPDYCLYNTSSPDVRIEVLGPLGHYITLQAEDYDSLGGSASVVSRTSASEGEAVNCTGYSTITYSITPEETISNAVVEVRYSDPSGGSTMEVLLNGVKSGETVTEATSGDDYYLKSKQVYLADTLSAGQTYNVALRFPTGGAAVDFLAVMTGFDVDIERDWHQIITSARWWSTDSSEPLQYNVNRALSDMEIDHSSQPNELTSVIKVDYDKSHGDTASIQAYGGVAAQIPPTDMTEKDYLSFWVYNNGSPLTLRVRLEDTEGGAWETSWAEGDPSLRTSDADWESIVVDLTRTFNAHNAGAIDMTKINNIIFIADPGSTTSSGRFYLDDITLLSAPEEAPIETFENDYYGWMVGSNGVFSITNTTEAAHNQNQADSLGATSLKITWEDKGLNWHNVVYDCRHDTNDAPVNRIGNYVDLTADGMSGLTLWVKSDSHNEFGIELKVYDEIPGYDPVTGLIDENNPGHSVELGEQTYTGAGEWQKLYWPFNDSTVVEDAKQIYFFPFPQQATHEPGTIYIDDFCLDVVSENATILNQVVDEILEQMDLIEYDIVTIMEIMIAAGAGYTVIKMIKDFLRQWQAWRDTFDGCRHLITKHLKDHPTITWWGGIYGYGLLCGMAWSHAWEVDGAVATMAKYTSTLAIGVATHCIGKVLIPKMVDVVIEEELILPENPDFSAGIPDGYKTYAMFPIRVFEHDDPALPVLKDSILKTLEVEPVLKNIEIWVVSDSDPEFVDEEIAVLQDIRNNYGYDDNSDVSLNHIVRTKRYWKKPGAEMDSALWWLGEWERLAAPIVPPDDVKKNPKFKFGKREIELPFYPNIEGRGASGDTGPYQVGDECRFRQCWRDGTLYGSPTAVTVPCALEEDAHLNINHFDVGNFFTEIEDSAVGPMVKGAAKLYHSDNINPDGSLKYTMITPAMVPMDPEELPTGWARLMAREQGRYQFILSAFKKLWDGGVNYGKNITDAREFVERLGWVPDFIMSHDLLDGLHHKNIFDLELKLQDDAPPNVKAMFVRDVRWMGGDRMTAISMLTEKIVTLWHGVQKNPYDLNGKLLIVGNYLPRFGDPSLLALMTWGAAARLFPDSIQVVSPDTLWAMLFFNMVGIIGVPKLINTKNWNERGLAVFDTIMSTMQLLPNAVNNSVFLGKDMWSYIKGEKPNWIPSASASEHITLREAVENYKYSMRYGWSYFLVMAYAGAEMGLLEKFMLVDFCGAAPVAAWLMSYSKEDLVQKFRDYYEGLKLGIERLKGDEKAELAPIEELEDFGQLENQIPAGDDMKWWEDFHDATLDKTKGTIELYHKSSEEVLAQITHDSSDDLTDLLIDDYSASSHIQSLSDGDATADSAAKILFRQAFDNNKETVTRTGIKTTLLSSGDPMDNMVSSLLEDGYLSDGGVSGGYHYYTFSPTFFTAAWDETGESEEVSVDGSSGHHNINKGTTPLVTDGALVAKAFALTDGVIQFTTMDDVSHVLSESDLIAKLGGEDLIINVNNPDSSVLTVTIRETADGLRMFADGYEIDLKNTVVTIEQMGVPEELVEAGIVEPKYGIRMEPMAKSTANALTTQFASRAEMNRATIITLSYTYKGEPSIYLWGDQSGINYPAEWLTDASRQNVNNLLRVNEAGVPWGMAEIGKDGAIDVAGEFFFGKDAAKILPETKAITLDMKSVFTSELRLLEAVNMNEAGNFPIVTEVDGQVVVLTKQEMINIMKKAGWREGFDGEVKVLPEELLGRHEVTFGFIRDAEGKIVDGEFVYVRNGGVQQVINKGYGPLGRWWYDQATLTTAFRANRYGEVLEVYQPEIIELKPSNLKELTYKGIKLFGHKTCMVLITLGQIMVLEEKYNSDEWHAKDEWYADLIRAGTYIGGWGVSPYVFGAMTAVMAAGGASAGLIFGMSMLAIYPYHVLNECQSEFQAQCEINWNAPDNLGYFEDLSLWDQYYGTSCRAWHMTMAEMSEKYLRTPYSDSTGKGALQGYITETMVDRWMDDHSEELSSGELGDTDLRDIRFYSSKIADLYAESYQEMIVDPLMRGLSWRVGSSPLLSGADEYGASRPMFFGAYVSTYPPGCDYASIPVPIPVQTATVGDKDLATVMSHQIYRFWKLLAEGDGKGIDPLSTYVNPEDELTLEDVRMLVCADIKGREMYLAMHEDASISTWYEPEDFVQWVGGMAQSSFDSLAPYWCVDNVWMADCRVGTNTCAELVDALSFDTFSDLGLASELMVNAGVEGEGSYRGEKSYSSEVAAPANTHTVPANETLPHVRYRWDVRGKNVQGAGAASETREFIVTE